MRFKTSFFNYTLIKEDFKRFWGIGALYFLLLLFTGPVYIFMINNENPDRVNDVIKNFVDIYSNGFEFIYTVIIPIILGILVFRYLQLKNSAGMIHALPFTRNMLLNSHILSGIVILLVPVLLNLIIMLITYTNLYIDTGVGPEVLISDIYHWFFITLLLNYTTFFMTIFTGIISGVSFVQGMLSLIFLFLPVGLTGLIMVSLDQMLFGFVPNDNILGDFAMKIIPITSGFDKAELSPFLILWYLILVFGLFLASRFLYQKRNLENASDTIVFSIFKPLFKYGVTFCTMILGGLYFSEVVRGTQAWLYFGFLIGALFGYIIAEMILQKSIWVFKKLSGLVPFLIVATLLVGAIEFDVMRYEKRLPDINKVKSVYFGYYINQETFEDESQLFREKENIMNIKQFHQMIIEHQKEIENSNKRRIDGIRMTNVAIGYQYKNGNTLIREYRIPNTIMHGNSYIKEIYESKEYKIINNKIFREDVDNVDYIYIQARDVDREIKIIDPNEIKEFIEIIKQDILNQTYEEMISDQVNWADIRIAYSEKLEKEFDENEKRYRTIHLNWEKSYKELEKWLKEKGYYQDARILPKDIDYAVIGEVENSVDLDRIYKETLAFNAADIKGLKEKTMEVKDEERIEQLLRSYHRSSLEDRKYVVIFYLKNGREVIGWYSEENALDFIKAYF